MAFNFLNLDEEIRNLMLQEIDWDLANNGLYYSKRFNEQGCRSYPEILKEAVKNHNEEYLAEKLKVNNCFKSMESRETKKGVIMVKVPSDASLNFAEGEFNRFYIRALCLKVMNDKKGELEVYRAKEVSAPRLESQLKIGKIIAPEQLLADLRENKGMDTALGLPSGANSGLSVKIS